MPILLAGHIGSVPRIIFYYTPTWLRYQFLRFLILWAALWTDTAAFGLSHAALVAGLMGLTLRFDYWSNCVELLASVLVAAGGVLSLSLAGAIGLGVLLGFGRETLPLLCLAGGWGIGSGAFAAQALLRLTTKTAPEYRPHETTMEHGKSQLVYNLSVLFGGQIMFRYEAFFYLLIAGLALFTAPLLTVALVGITLWIARVDEPRVLTMLVPFAASTVLRFI